ncbi:MAG: PIN domain-containing protein [Candidatus Micrarchaeota archaeon]|nr:PIN domain-containing protein [Candidatus Micrarchaeota archaeon]
MQIIVDTSFLLSHYEYKVDIYSHLNIISNGPVHILVPSVVLSEVHRLSKKKGRKAAAARFALACLEKMKKPFNIRVIASGGKADEWIIKYCSKNKEVSVATNDVELHRKLNKLGVGVITLKGKSKLGFI